MSNLGLRVSRCFIGSLFLIAFSLLPREAQAKGFQTQTPPPQYQVGVGPFFSVAADLRGTGRKDLIVSNSAVSNGIGTSKTISVLLSNPDGTYATAVNYTVGNNPIGIAVGDFTGNGKLDLAVASVRDNTITILLGNGDGTFQEPAAHIVASGGPNPTGIYAADLRGNGKLDLVVMNSDFVGTDSCATSNVSVLLGNGNGTFGTPAIVATGVCPFLGAVANLGNGHQDIMFVNTGGESANAAESIGVLIGNGTGSFATEVKYPVGTRPQDMAVADFNDDNKLDVVVACKGDKNTGANGGVDLLTGKGDGTFNAASFISGTTAGAKNIAAADFNGDGKADFAITEQNSNGGVAVFLGNGNGTFQTAKTSSFSSGSNGGDGTLTAADLNGDGNQDLAALVDNSPNPGDVAVLLGNGDGTFGSAIGTYSFGSSPQSIAVANFNNANPNEQDLAVGLTNFNGTQASSVAVLSGIGNGTFAQGPSINLNSNANGSGVATGSFKNNGKQDIVVSQNSQAGSGFLSYVAGNGNGTFAAPVTTAFGPPNGINPFQISAADLNKDGNFDVVLGDCGGLDFFLGNGNGTFGGRNSLSANGFCVGGQVAVGDLNGDGFPDIVVTNVNTGNLDAYVYLNNGSGGGFTGPTLYAIGTGPSNFQVLGVALGHFKESNTAGHLDIAVTNPNNNTVTILTNNGDGTFTKGTSYTVGTNPVYIASGDFHGTGHTDLAVANCSNCNMGNGSGSTVNILYGKGDGTFTLDPVAYVAGAGSQAIGVGDYNGDGAPDLAVANSNDQDVTILLNTGGTFDILTSSGSPSTAGQTVTFTDKISPSVLSTSPTGTVQFLNNGAALGSPVNVSGGKAVLVTNGLPVGADSITGIYSGDANYNAKTSNAVAQVVTKGASITTLSAAPDPAEVNQTVTLTATVSGAGATPTGTVDFKDGGVTIAPGIALASGSASTMTSFSSNGVHVLTAVYSGDTNYSASTSSNFNETVNLIPTTTTLGSGTNPSVAGNPVTFTATVSAASGGTPAGSVTFTAIGQTTPPAVPLTAGVATQAFTFNTQGSFSVQATYAPSDTNHAGSASAPLTQIVNCSTCTNTTTSLVLSSVLPNDPGEPAGTVRLLQSATFNVMVTASTGTTAPTGNVQLQDNGVNLGSAKALPAGGGTSSTVMIQVTNFTIGPHNVTAVYSGLTNSFNASISTPVAVQRSPKPR